MDYLRDRTFLIYAAAVALVFVCALASRKSVLIWTGSVLFADWLASNVAVASWGFTYAPFIYPILDAMFLGFTVWIWRDSGRRSDAVAMVAYLYLVAILAWGTFGLTGTQNGYLCYLTANLIFALQLIVLGGASAWRVVGAGVDRLSRLGFIRFARGAWAHRVHGVGSAPGPEGP